MTLTTRRAVLAGGACALALPPFAAVAADSADRRFDIIRGGDRIGEHLTSVRRDGDALEVATDIDIVVRILGIAAYRYTLTSRERWEGGLLVSLDSDANDDGEVTAARVRRTEGGLLVADGSWKGEIPGDAATTTYWTPAFLERPIWISTQTGAPLEVSPRRQGAEAIPTPRGPVEATRWRSDGDLPVTMFYDARGEWVGNAFDAGGTEARFVMVEDGGPMTPLWTGA